MDIEWLQLAIESWRKPIGLVAALVAVSTAIPTLLGLSGVSLAWLTTACLVVAGVWVSSRRVPRADINRIGIAVAVIPEEDPAAERFARDFLFEIKRLVPLGTSGRAFQLINIPPHAISVDDIADDGRLQKLRMKTRSVFLMLAVIRTRAHAGKTSTVLDLKAIVGHAPLNTAVQEQLASEFGELMPGRIQFQSESEVLNFVVSGEWTVLVAKYIIGIAAALSGLLDNAEQLQLDVQKALATTKVKGSAVHSTLRSRIPQRLAEIRDARARAALERWVENPVQEHLATLSENVLAIPESQQKVARVLNIRAIAAFVCGRQIKEALAILNDPAMPRDIGWYYNMGFLHAYQGNLMKAAQFYSKAVVMTHPPTLVTELEAFITAVLKLEPARKQLHYCLGVLNLEVRGDLLRAEEEFVRFLQGAETNRFPLQRKRAEQWLETIRRKEHVAEKQS
jgi:hypothetical protein